jgi:hypothetical protein
MGLLPSMDWFATGSDRTFGGRRWYEGRPALLRRATDVATRGDRRRTGLLPRVAGLATRGAVVATMARRCCCHRLPTLLQRHIGAANKAHRRCYRRLSPLLQAAAA